MRMRIHGIHVSDTRKKSLLPLPVPTWSGTTEVQGAGNSQDGRTRNWWNSVSLVTSNILYQTHNVPKLEATSVFTPFRKFWWAQVHGDVSGADGPPGRGRCPATQPRRGLPLAGPPGPVLRWRRHHSVLRQSVRFRRQTYGEPPPQHAQPSWWWRRVPQRGSVRCLPTPRCSEERKRI